MNPGKIPDVREEDRSFFREQGYWLSPKIFEQDELDRLADAQDAVNAGRYETGNAPADVYWRPGDDADAVRKIDNTHLANRTLFACVTHAGLGATAADLLGVDMIRLWHDQLLYKPPGGKSSGSIPWHQDYNFWKCSDRPEMITAWIPLHDVDEANGTMMVVPGSHRWGWHEAYSPCDEVVDIEAQRKGIAAHVPRGATFQAEPVTLKAGQVSFHHCLTLHGSGPNRAERPRRSLVAHLQSGDCRWSSDPASDGHLCAREMKRMSKCPGDRFEGAWWPRLHDASDLGNA